ncbi:2-hydroxyacyl-CoA dehydratase, partial [Verrucomicrobiota bacterium]
MKTIIYSSPFVPAEWIAAHGIKPVRLTPASQDCAGPIKTSEGICPYMMSFINTALSRKPSAIITTTTCDQMRRAPDVAGIEDIPFFVMNIPATWQTAQSLNLYISELKRLGRFMCDLGGNPPKQDELISVMNQYEEERSKLRSSRGITKPRIFSENIMLFNETGAFTTISSTKDS